MPIYKTAESVSPKHPDKICDQLSDAILDAYLKNDPTSRVAVECVGGHGKVLVIGEVKSASKINIKPIVKRLAGDNIETEIRVVQQSPEIAQGVEIGGAGDQGIMVGYACDETPEMLPIETVLARKLNQFLFAKWPFDGKTQITTKNSAVLSVVASFQHTTRQDLEKTIWQWLDKEPLVKSTSAINIYANPAGDWQLGGFDADTGLTGRKLVIDNYGPHIPIGGGAFSGKDASKVDRSAAYMARKIAIDYLIKHRAHEVYVELAYAIGYQEPLEATVKIGPKTEAIKGYDLTPKGIIDYLDLTKPKFEQTARWGHFGHNEFKWESR